MANNNGSIDEIIGQEAIKGVDVTTQKMEQLYKVFMQNIVVVNSLNASLGDVKGLKEVSKLIDDLTKATTTTTKAVKDYTQEQANAAVERQRTMNEMKGIARETLETMGAYDKLNAAHKRVQKEAMNVGVALGVESKEFAELTKRANEYQAVLSKVEQKAGNNTRIMGDYRQQLFGLSQVFRELPAFTYSAQTGILGLSNNLPILADGFKQVAAATNEATGKVNGTIGALKIFGASIFSFSNVFAIAIGLFTIFSKQIFDAIKGTNELDKETKEYTKSLGVTEGKIRTSIEILNNKNLSHKEHLKVAKELKDLYPVTLKNYSLEEIASGRAAKAIETLRVSIVNLAKAKAVQSDIDAQAGRQYEIEKLRAGSMQRIIQLQKQEADQKKVLARTRAGSDRYDAQAAILADISDRLVDERDNLIELTNEYTKIDTVISGLAAKVSNLTANTIDETRPTSSSPQKVRTTKAKKEKVDLYTEEEHRKTLRQLDEQIAAWDKMTDKELADLAKKYKAQYDFNEKAFQQELDMINSNLAGQERMYQREDELNREAFDKKMKRLNTYNELVQSASFAFSTVSDIIAQREIAAIDARDKALTDYYNNEIRFIDQSGMSSAKKEKEKQKLEAETEAKRKQIDRDRITAARKQASVQKVIDVASIIASTAVAVMAALGMKPYTPANIALAAGAGITGAAQLAKAIATPLPQYYKGRKGGKAEWAETNEYGAELHVTKEGKAYIPNQGLRGATFLDEGTSVLPADITREIMKSTYVSLADGSKVTTDRMQAAMLDKLDGILFENQQLRKALIDKEFSSNYVDLSAYRSYKASHIK